MVGGVYGEVVYDNMRNVATKFIGRNEKELNPDLLKMSPSSNANIFYFLDTIMLCEDNLWVYN
jgi:hypothetical protein